MGLDKRYYRVEESRMATRYQEKVRIKSCRNSAELIFRWNDSFESRYPFHVGNAHMNSTYSVCASNTLMSSKVERESCRTQWS